MESFWRSESVFWQRGDDYSDYVREWSRLFIIKLLQLYSRNGWFNAV
jgi:hypothetical protein